MPNPIAAVYCVHNDDEWFEASLHSIYSSVDAVIVLLGEAPWNGPKTDNTHTQNILKTFPDPDRKLSVIPGDWKSEVEQRNFGLALLEVHGFSYMLIIDADEIYNSNELTRMLDHARSNPEVGCWHALFHVYWKSAKYRIDPPENHHPPILFKVGTGGFVEYRNCLSSLRHELIPTALGVCHHMSYARTDEQIKRKIASFSHSHQINPDWFEKTWKAWDQDHNITDLCPYNPGVFHRTIEVSPDSLPPILRK